MNNLSLHYGGPKVSRQFQFYSPQLISICSRQFRNFAQGNFNFFTAMLTAFFASLTTCQLRRPTETKSMADKTQNQKWIVKVDLQREKWNQNQKSISFHAFTDLKMNSDRSNFISVTDPTRVAFVPVWDRTVLIKKQKTNLRPGP